MADNFYTGVVIPGPLPDAYSYEVKPRTHTEFHHALTIPQKLEVIYDHATQLAQKMLRNRTIVSANHLKLGNGSKVRLGRVEDAWVDRQKGLMARFSLDESLDGADFVKRLIDSGHFGELSLQHDHANMEPLELSICREGCRPGTSILKTNSKDYNLNNTDHSVSSPTSGPASHSSAPPIIVSATYSDIMMATQQMGHSGPAVIGAIGNGTSTLLTQNDLQTASKQQPPAKKRKQVGFQQAPAAESKKMEMERSVDGEEEEEEDENESGDPKEQQQAAGISKKKDAAERAAEKLLGGSNIFSKDERAAMLNAFANAEKLKKESQSLNDQKLAVFVEELSEMVKNYAGRELFKDKEAAFNALRRGEASAVAAEANEIIVSANRSRMAQDSSYQQQQQQQAPARQQQQQSSAVETADDGMKQAFQEFMRYKNSNPTPASLPNISPTYNNGSVTGLPPVVISANRQQMQYDQQQHYQQDYSGTPSTMIDKGPWGALPQTTYISELNAAYNNRWGMGFKPGQVLSPDTLASMGAPISQSALNSSSGQASLGYSNRPFDLSSLPAGQQRQRQR